MQQVIYILMISQQVPWWVNNTLEVLRGSGTNDKAGSHLNLLRWVRSTYNKRNASSSN